MTENNSMYGFFRLKGDGSDDLGSSLAISSRNSMQGNFILIPNKTDDLESSLYVPYVHDLLSVINVRPHNKMEGIANIVLAPSEVVTLTPTKDSYVRSGLPTMNYGSDEDMFVGATSGGEVFRSLLEFNISSIPLKRKIRRAELVLNIINIGSDFELKLSELIGSWTELGVTWDNQPSMGDLINLAHSGNNSGELRIDIRDFISKWYTQNKSLRKSIEISSSDETLPVTKDFTTKENTTIKPYLEVEYFDPLIYSFGNANLPGSIVARMVNFDYSDLSSSIRPRTASEANLVSKIVVRRSKDTDFNGSIDVHKVSDLPSSMTVYVNATNDLTSKLLVSWSADLPSSLVVHHTSDLESSVVVRQTENNDLHGNLTVKYYDNLVSSLAVHHISDLESAIVARAIGYDDFLGSLTVKFYSDLVSSLYVANISKLDSSLIVAINDLSDLEGTITVNNYYDLRSSIMVDHSSELESRITVYRNDKSQLVSSIAIRSENSMGGGFVLKGDGHSDIPGSMEVKRFIYSGVTELEGSIKVTSTNCMGGGFHLMGQGYSEIQGIIKVYKSGKKDLISSITVHHSSDLPSQIITHRMSNLVGSIRPRPVGKSDLSGFIMPRIILPGDLKSSIDVKNIRRNHAYAFIM